ncbi:kell blood group glycoprotein isoform X1 [Simochromis diagramma]|uniref:kell blood group glycoprotein isoform X1 n=2 Tax=Simochromis diagramma TaxID=43689 RepID=UPI001A7EFF12|nr:kell blood group glycoprotein isoform X1 [Simochromis diagramma]
MSYSNIEHRVKPAWMKHRKCLLFLLSCILLAGMMGLIKHLSHRFHTVTPCLSPACQWASARLSTSADPFTQPCDYFLFTCGSDRLLLDSERQQRSHGFTLHAENQRKSVQSKQEDGGLTEDKTLSRKAVLLQYLKKILETDSGMNSSAVQKTKGFYNSCLDTKSIETAGADPFLSLIKKLGGWAVSGQWNQTDFNTTLGLLMRDYNTFPFFNIYVGKEPYEAARGINKKYIQIDQPDLLIPIEWNSKTEKSRAKTETLRPFLASCQQYLNLLGAPKSSSLIHVGSFVSLSSQLAVASSPLDSRLSKGQLYQRMTIKELQRQAPAIDWLGCLQAAFHPLSLSADDDVLLHNLPYIVQMSNTIIKWQNKPELRNSAPLHTFMVLNLLHTLMPAMDSRFFETAKNFSMALGNTEEEAPRWKHCVLETERGFDSVLTHLLSEVTAQKEAEKIIQSVFHSFKSKLNEFEWTDQTSRQLVMEKVDSAIPKLWTTKEPSSEAKLDLLFSEMIVSNQNFFSNYVQLLSLWQKKRIELLITEPEDIDILSVTPFLFGKKLLFPLGMFVPPLFHPTYPRAINYGAAGFLVAKDILHLLLPDISSQSKTVNAVGECVWTHYLTVSEKAGRGGGFPLSAAQQQEVWVQYTALQVALQAYHQNLMQQPNDTSLSGISYTRLFFRSFSQRLPSGFSSIRFKQRLEMHPRQIPQSQPRLTSPSSSSVWFPSANTEAASPWQNSNRCWQLEAMMWPRTTGE